MYWALLNLCWTVEAKQYMCMLVSGVSFGIFRFIGGEFIILSDDASSIFL